MKDPEYILRLFNVDERTTPERLKLLQETNLNFCEYDEKITMENGTVLFLRTERDHLNRYFSEYFQETTNCLTFIHETRFKTIDKNISNWNQKCLQYQYIVLISGGEIENDRKNEILIEATKKKFHQHLFFIQIPFNADNIDKSLLKKFVDGFISFSTDRKTTLEELHEIIIEINHPPNLEYLPAIALLCQGYLVVHHLYFQSDETWNNSKDQNVIDALQKIGLLSESTFSSELIQTLCSKYHEVIKREYWAEVFDPTFSDYEVNFKKEWARKDGEELPDGLKIFLSFLANKSVTLSPSDVARIFNDVFKVFGT